MYPFHLLETQDDLLTFQDAYSHHFGEGLEMKHLQNSKVFALCNANHRMLGGFILHYASPPSEKPADSRNGKPCPEVLDPSNDICEVTGIWICNEQGTELTRYVLYLWMAFEVWFTPAGRFTLITRREDFREMVAAVPGMVGERNGLQAEENPSCQSGVFSGPKGALLKGARQIIALWIRKHLTLGFAFSKKRKPAIA